MQTAQLKPLTAKEMTRADVKILKGVWIVGAAIGTLYFSAIAFVIYLGGGFSA